MKSLLALIPAIALAPAAFAQTSNIDPSHKFSWGENIGWMNWQGAGSPAGSQGALINPNILSGFVWCENVGYLNLGDGTPANGFAYANLNGTDFGVNLLPDDRLSGFAWGENIGWINLDDATKFVGLQCPADLDNGSNTGTPDGGIDINDLLYFLGTFELGAPGADLDNGTGNGIPDGGVDINDLLYFLLHFEAGC